MKRSLLFLRQLWECDRGPASLLPSRLKSGAKTPRTPKALRPKSSKLILVAFLSILFAAQEAFACPFCYGAKDGKSSEHMAVAIWFLFGAVLSVMGGVGAFGFHLWRHGRTPMPPHQELTEEDLSKYE
ncbi:MAG TPA: hypothetical protein VH227_04545 [Candidatus Udaeobacter sp.]|jgi:hypothetical protein|nr:hypothetical protein [Candidatus Udaeobacter sp.]